MLPCGNAGKKYIADSDSSPQTITTTFGGCMKSLVNQITRYKKSTGSDFTFSIIIPSWNNLNFLKCCINSLHANSAYNNQIIVLANEATDGTLQWLEHRPFVDVVHASANIGICYGLNATRALVKAEYIVYMNDDMYALPNWDAELKKAIEKIGHKAFMVSATMVEPTKTGNKCVVVKDFGRDLHSFNEKLLLSEHKNLKRENWNGSTWPPNAMHIDMWDLVGGMSPEFSPGMYSDPDLSKKLYDAGVRTFLGVGSSLVYHFGSKSTRRIRRNKGSDTFLRKWHMSANTFMQQVLKIGQPFAELEENATISAGHKLKNTAKRILKSL